MRRVYSVLWMKVALKSFLAMSKVYYFYMIPGDFPGRQKTNFSFVSKLFFNIRAKRINLPSHVIN